MQALASKAYGQATQRTATGKALELALFDQITQALEHVHATNGEDVGLWGDTLHRNMQLWAVIGSDVLHPENALPAEMRRGLFSLSEFVRRTSMNVLAGAEGLADLIEVNRTIMVGLDGMAMPMEQEVV